MPLGKLSGGRVSEAGTQKATAMYEFRTNMVAVFVDTYGKDSQNAVQVKALKSIFPNGCNIENCEDHQEFLKKVLALCPTMTCHISHLEKGAMKVHTENGLKRKKLDDAVEQDAREVKAAMIKIYKAKYYVDNYPESPNLKAWMKKFITLPQAEASPIKKQQLEQMPPKTLHKAADKQPKPDPKQAAAIKMKQASAEKFPIYVHSQDLTHSITVRVKHSYSMDSITKSIREAKTVFEDCNTVLDSATGRKIASAKELKAGESYKFVEKDIKLNTFIRVGEGGGEGGRAQARHCLLYSML